MRDLSDHDESKEPKKGGFLGSFKETQNPFSESFGFKNPISDFIKETHPKHSYTEWVYVKLVLLFCY